MFGVTNHRIRRLIKAGVIAAEQVVPGAPYQIRASDLQDECVTKADAGGLFAPSTSIPKINFQCLQKVHNDSVVAIIRQNALFAGSDGGGRTWATIATLLATVRLNNIDRRHGSSRHSNASPAAGPIANSMLSCPGITPAAERPRLRAYAEAHDNFTARQFYCTAIRSMISVITRGAEGLGGFNAYDGELVAHTGG